MYRFATPGARETVIGVSPGMTVTVAVLLCAGAVLLLTAITIPAFEVTCCGAV